LFAAARWPCFERWLLPRFRWSGPAAVLASSGYGVCYGTGRRREPECETLLVAWVKVYRQVLADAMVICLLNGGCCGQLHSWNDVSAQVWYHACGAAKEVLGRGFRWVHGTHRLLVWTSMGTVDWQLGAVNFCGGQLHAHYNSHIKDIYQFDVPHTS